MKGSSKQYNLHLLYTYLYLILYGEGMCAHAHIICEHVCKCQYLNSGVILQEPSFQACVCVVYMYWGKCTCVCRWRPEASTDCSLLLSILIFNNIFILYVRCFNCLYIYIYVPCVCAWCQKGASDLNWSYRCCELL